VGRPAGQAETLEEGRGARVNSLRALTPARSRVPGGGAGLLSLCAPVVLLLALVGCKSTGVPPETYCYRVTGAVVTTIDSGMKVAGDLYRDGRLSETQKAKLVAAHNVYRPAAQAAVAGCKAVGSQKDADEMVKRIKEAADKILETLVAAGVL